MRHVTGGSAGGGLCFDLLVASAYIIR